MVHLKVDVIDVPLSTRKYFYFKRSYYLALCILKGFELVFFISVFTQMEYNGHEVKLYYTFPDFICLGGCHRFIIFSREVPLPQMFSIVFHM